MKITEQTAMLMMDFAYIVGLEISPDTAPIDMVNLVADIFKDFCEVKGIDEVETEEERFHQALTCDCRREEEFGSCRGCEYADECMKIEEVSEWETLTDNLEKIVTTCPHLEDGNIKACQTCPHVIACYEYWRG